MQKITTQRARVLELNSAMQNLLENRIVSAIRTAERRLYLPPQGDAEASRLAGLAISTGTLTPKGIERMVAQPYVDAILDVRTKPMRRGRLKGEVQDVANSIEAALVSGTFIGGKTLVQYAGDPSRDRNIARSIAILIALHYSENGHVPNAITPRLNALLPFLSEHLQTETEIAVEHKFELPSRNLTKYSVFEIAEKLESLKGHEDAVVRKMARSILHAALRRGDLSFADGLAKGTKLKYDELLAHGDEIVRRNAKSILHAALMSGNLSVADELAEQVSSSQLGIWALRKAARV